MIRVKSYNMAKIDEDINFALAKTNNNLELVAKYFLGAPYLFEALGEGELGSYSQEPLYRADCFDCVTYVNTVMALTFAKSLSEFKNIINKIRYKNSVPKYINRTDWFTDLEWIPNMQSLGFLSDATTCDGVEIAETLIGEPPRAYARGITSA